MCSTVIWCVVSFCSVYTVYSANITGWIYSFHKYDEPKFLIQNSVWLLVMLLQLFYSFDAWVFRVKSPPDFQNSGILSAAANDVLWWLPFHKNEQLSCQSVLSNWIKPTKQDVIVDISLEFSTFHTGHENTLPFDWYLCTSVVCKWPFLPWECCIYFAA